MTDRRGNIIRLLPPPIPPKFVRELSITEDTGSTAVNAVEYGIPTVRQHTPDLDAEQRRLRATVYFVRYNDLTDEQKLICSGPNVPKHEWLGHKKAYSKLRKKLQAEMIGIGQNSPGWFIQYVKSEVALYDYKVHLHNLLRKVKIIEVKPASETGAQEAVRLANAARFRKAYTDHKERWIGTIKEAIKVISTKLESLPYYGDKSNEKVEQYRVEKDRLQGVLNAAIGYTPFADIYYARETSIEAELDTYCCLERKFRVDFWKNGRWTPNHAASLYAFVDSIIDVKACLLNKDMRTIMARTWVVCCMMAYQHVVGPQLANEAIEMFADTESRVRSEARHFDAPQLVYDAFKAVNVKAGVAAGINIVMMRGLSTPSKRRKISSGKIPLIDDLGDMGGMDGLPV